MRSIRVAAALFFLFTTLSSAENISQRLNGLAYTEGAGKELRIQVWALGEQVESHPEWQFEAIFNGAAASGERFEIELGEARLPVLVEIGAKGHAGVSLNIVIPEQLSMPPVWLREGSPVRIRVSRPRGEKERTLVWGGVWTDDWDLDARRWRSAIPHIEVPQNGDFEILVPPISKTLWVAGMSENGAFGSAVSKGLKDGGAVDLKIDSAPIPVRVWDERRRPAVGVRLAEASSPFQLAVVTDDEGCAKVHVPLTGEWNIVGTSPDSMGIVPGRGHPTAEIDLDLKPRVDISLRWPETLGTVVIQNRSASQRMGHAPKVFSSGTAILPMSATSAQFDYWGPEVAPGRIRIVDQKGPLPLKAQRAVRIEGKVVSAHGMPMGGLPVWMRISRSTMSTRQAYGPGGRATPLERPWLPWSVTDTAGRFTIAGLPPSECEVEVRAPGLPAARSKRLKGEEGTVLETTVTLNLGAAVALRTMNSGGEPLSGVMIDVYRSDEPENYSWNGLYPSRDPQRGDPGLTAVSDDEGRAVLTNAPIGRLRLRLTRPGLVTRIIDKIEVPPEGIDIGDQIMEIGVTLTGMTVGPDGEPIGEAEVAFGRNPQMPFFRSSLSSDSEGRFSIHDLEPAGELYLQAKADGFVPAAPLKVEMPPGGEFEIPMEKECTLEGLVLNGQDEMPIEAAQAHLSMRKSVSIPGSPAAGQALSSAGRSKTDTNGHFFFDGLGPGEYDLHVTAEGKRKVQQKVLVGVADTEPLIIRLDPGLALRGRVEMEEGEVASGLMVHASPTSSSLGRAPQAYSATLTDADGRFHLDDLGPGTHTVSVRTEDGRTGKATAEAGQPDEIVLSIPQGTVIGGIVYGPEGTPISGATIRGHGRSTGQSASVETGQDGRYELKNAAPGNWRLVAMAEGFARADEVIEVPEDEPVTVDFRLDRGATIIGEIRGLGASELETCIVRVGGGGSERPSADGRFRLTGVPSGERQVVAMETATRRSRTVVVEVPESGVSEPVVIDFSSGVLVHGRVLRGSSAAPGLAVSAFGVVTNASSETISGPDGRWRIEGLAPGEYQVAVHSRSGEILTGEHIVLEADTELDLSLPFGTLSGRVLEADSQRPIEGATITVTGASIPPISRAVTSNASGAFEVTELDDGDYSVQAEAPGRMPAQEQISLSDGATSVLSLLLEASSSTVLLVREADGTSPSRIAISSLMGGVLGPTIFSTCDSGGRCKVDDLPRGRWTLFVKAQGAAIVVADFPSEEVSVQLRATGKLKIEAPQDERGAGWQVRLSDSATGITIPIKWFYGTGIGEWIVVPATGFKLDVPEGAWRVESVAPDGTQSAHEVTVSGGETTTVILE